MSEAQRLLRYVIPGAVGESLFAVWLYLDSVLCPECYASPSVDGNPVLAVILLGAPLPIGFLASNLYSSVVWWEKGRRENRPQDAWIFHWIDEPALLRSHGSSTLREKGHLQQGAALDALWHVRAAAAGLDAGLSRGRALLDLMSGLGSVVAVVVMAMLTVLATFVWTSVSTTDEPDLARVALLLLAEGLMLGVVAAFLSSQRRVTEVATSYIDNLLRLSQFESD